MATICGGIAANVNNDCEKAPVGGLEKQIILINRDDLLGFTSDADDKLIINELTMKSGKRGYSWNVLSNNGHKANFASVKKDWGGTQFTHAINTIVTENSTGNKKTLNDMKGGLYIVAVINRSRKTDVLVELYGLDCGLEVNTLQRNSDENDGIYQLTLQSEEGAEEPNIPATFQVLDEDDVYDPAATLSALTALLTPAV